MNLVMVICTILLILFGFGMWSDHEARTKAPEDVCIDSIMFRYSGKIKNPYPLIKDGNFVSCK